MAGRGNQGLPPEEQKLKDQIVALSDKIAKAGDKALQADKDKRAELQTQASKLKVKRVLGARVAAFQQAAERLRMAAGGHSDAQRDFVHKLVADHSQTITEAFNQKAPPKRAAKVQIPD